MLPTNENIFEEIKMDQKWTKECYMYITSHNFFFFLCINETTSHILWRCLASNDVWAGCNRKIQKYSNEKDNFICILDKLMTKIDEEDFWFCRNMVVFGGELTHSSQLVGCTEESLKEFHQAPSRSRIQVEDNWVSTNLAWRTPHWVWQR